MLTISKPLSAAQIRSYHAEEFSNARDNYYTAADRIGRLVEFGPTASIFTNPSEKRTEDYITGRFG